MKNALESFGNRADDMEERTGKDRNGSFDGQYLSPGSCSDKNAKNDIECFHLFSSRYFKC